jgi:alpha-tubulin suppressor-like RCC1 family protein
MGLNQEMQDIQEYQKFVNPELVEDLIGEEGVQVSVGSSHASAVSKGGDCYVWGYGKCGALGLGNFKNQLIPAVVTGFGDTDQVKIVACGENHTCCLTDKGEVYSWGHVSDGRLGLGARERVGVSDEEKVSAGRGGGGRDDRVYPVPYPWYPPCVIPTFLAFVSGKQYLADF